MERKDNYKDFLVLEFSQTRSGKLDIYFITSSAKYDPQIKRLLKVTDTQKCRRVEEFFRIENMIRLRHRQKRRVSLAA